MSLLPLATLRAVEMRRKIGQPRFIDVSLIENGDEISVEYPTDRGITTTLKGIVDHRTDHGKTRYLMTAENATLVSWEPKKNAKVRVTLYSRLEPEGATIFDLPDEIRERMRA